ncbi:hypothetical protein [Sulfobacillus thermosulfidooxidans]|uniref:hypothetical protein n=1 Tax=Sulfobacillus thermosulfidooxidans TaxID=28034 RepID=UPI001FA8C246|nr:hypothetical protein [Sulfobacillus thermosulfidooxidans]
MAKRIYDARVENGIDAVEVFLFTEGLKVLGETDSDLRQLIQCTAGAVDFGGRGHVAAESPSGGRVRHPRGGSGGGCLGGLGMMVLRRRRPWMAEETRAWR